MGRRYALKSAVVLAVLLCARLGVAQELPQLIMLDKEYKTYLELSEGQGLDRRVEIWVSVVEAPHQELYKAFVWQQKGPHGEKRMMEHRRKRLQQQQRLGGRTLALYEEFPETLEREFTAFQETFRPCPPTFEFISFPLSASTAKPAPFKVNKPFFSAPT